MNSTSASTQKIDIGLFLDSSPLMGMQKIVIFMAAMAIILDGFDSQLIGFAIPQLIEKWGVSRAAFSSVLAAGLIGMAIGMACGGCLADRIGRSRVLATSCLLFGTATILIGFASNVEGLTILRFIAGLGIGAALPCAATLTAEYTPARQRTMAITLTIVCFPLGGMIAGLFAAWVLSHHAWQWLFWVGGSMPVLLSFVLFVFLPESPRYLARHQRRWPELIHILKRMGHTLSESSEFADSAERAAPKKLGFKALFQAAFARDTIAICLAFFSVVLSLYSAFNWLPAVLSAEGLSMALASQALAAHNLGGVLGSLFCAYAITRFGSRVPLLICASLAALSAFAMLGLDISHNAGLVIAGFGIHGFFVNAVQTSLYGLCAYVYPTEVRATGMATALAFGRMGGILSAFIGAAVITFGGLSGFLVMLGVGMAAAVIALLLVRSHLPGKKRSARLTTANAH